MAERERRKERERDREMLRDGYQRVRWKRRVDSGSTGEYGGVNEGDEGSLKRRKRSLLHFKADVSPGSNGPRGLHALSTIIELPVIRSVTFTTDRENLLSAALHLSNASDASAALAFSKRWNPTSKRRGERSIRTIIDRAKVFRGQWDSISGDR